MRVQSSALGGAPVYTQHHQEERGENVAASSDHHEDLAENIPSVPLNITHHYHR